MSFTKIYGPTGGSAPTENLQQTTDAGNETTNTLVHKGSGSPSMERFHEGYLSEATSARIITNPCEFGNSGTNIGFLFIKFPVGVTPQMIKSLKVRYIVGGTATPSWGQFILDSSGTNAKMFISGIGTLLATAAVYTDGTNYFLRFGTSPMTNISMIVEEVILSNQTLALTENWSIIYSSSTTGYTLVYSFNANNVYTMATQTWANSNFVNTTGNQTGIAGDKTVTGDWTFQQLSGTDSRIVAVDSTGQIKPVNLDSTLNYDEGTDTLSVTNISSDLQVFHVDGKNPNAGDGSVLNPFQDLQAAIDAVIGSGTRTNPEYLGVSIKVASYIYNFNGNLCVQGVTWIFDNGTQIAFDNPSNYLIDTTALTTMTFPFKIVGYVSVQLISGGFINNQGVNTSSTYNRYVYAEVDNITSLTDLGTGAYETPVIKLVKTATGGGYSPPRVKLMISNRIYSIAQSIIDVQGCAKMEIRGVTPNAALLYGEQGSPSPQGSCIRYNGGTTDTEERAYSASLSVDNILLGGGGNDDIIKFSGQFGTSTYFDNVTFGITYGEAEVQSLINFGNLIPGRYNNTLDYVELVVRNCKVDSDLQIGLTEAFTFTGSNPGQNKVTMYGNYLPMGKVIDSDLDIADRGTVYNKYNQTLVFTGLPIFTDNAAALSGGLTTGALYQTGTMPNQLLVVI